MKSGYLKIGDHPLSTELRNNYSGILEDFLRIMGSLPPSLGHKPNNSLGSIINQKESNGSMLYYGTIRSVMTRVAIDSCSVPERVAVYGTTEESRKQGEDRLSDRRKLAPILESVIRPYIDSIGTVGFNIMRPGSTLSNHYGMISKYIRFHMGLVCDSEAKFNMSGYPPRPWEPGKVWAFDDGLSYHGTVHNGVTDRIILLVDVNKDMFTGLEEEVISW